jgi:hypothetical protein
LQTIIDSYVHVLISIDPYLYVLISIVKPSEKRRGKKDIDIHIDHFLFQLFLLPNFNLENPDTFNAVFPWTQVEESKVNQTGSRHSSKLLQEKVSIS